MGSYLITIIYFFFSSSAVMLLMLKGGFRRKVTGTLLLFFSYGVGPFMPALIFYGLIWLFPNRINLFYALILLVVYLFVFRFEIKQWSNLREVYSKLWIKLKWEIKSIPKIVIFVSVFFMGLYMTQLFAFPIINNDSVLYLNQSEAVYEYKNLNWQKKPEVLLNGNSTYIYNHAIRPGITSLIASNYLFIGAGRYNYFLFRFLVAYYYLLLFFLFLYYVKKVSIRLLRNSVYGISFGAIFYIFFWSLTRSLIFSAKEPIVYYFALLSVGLTVLIGREDKESWAKKILLGILLGINSFVNLHGIIVEGVILLVYFLISKQKILDRILSGIVILLVSIPFGGGEFLTMFSFVFVKSLGLGKQSKGLVVVANTTQDKYQIYNRLESFTKGKLQLLTNVGVFGPHFWLFLLIVARYLRRIMKNAFLKSIVLFIVFYYLIVIDPFSLNKNPISIVLSGSSKYATLLVFLGIIVNSVFIGDIINWLNDVLRKNSEKILVFVSALLLLLVVFYKEMISFGTDFLLFTIPKFKEASFYRDVVNKYYLIMLGLLVCLIVVLFFTKVKNEKKFTYYFSNIFILFITLTPFFMTTVGKVPLQDTFSFVGKSESEILENTYNKGDIFKVFLKAREVLPKGTVLKTEFNELSLYNRGHFLLLLSNSKKNYLYIIAKKCSEGEYDVYNSSGISLCGVSKDRAQL